MGIELNHMIVPAADGETSARWFADLFGLPEPRKMGWFWQVTVANGVDLDFDTHGEGVDFMTTHFAFLVSDEEFDEIFGRIVERDLPHWADPARTEPDQINHHFDGRGVYFCSNDDHFLEIITTPYELVPEPAPTP